MSTDTLRVNDAVIDAATIGEEACRFDGAPDAEAAARRALAVRELLLQRAGELGLLEGGRDRASVTFADRGAEDAVITALLDREVVVPTPTEDECRRHYDTHASRYVSGELVEASHILFAVTPGTPVGALRAQAERTLAALRADPSAFAEQAKTLSNCPSGALGGSLGQFGRGEMVPEFDAAVFGSAAIGVLPTLVATRYGFHVVLVERRIPGVQRPFGDVRDAIAATLTAHVTKRALLQYVELLAGEARVTGVDLAAASSPLVQ